MRGHLRVSRHLCFQRSSHPTHLSGFRRRRRLVVGHHRRCLTPRRMLEILGRLAHLPSTVVRLWTLELVLWRRVATLSALVAEIELQIFSGVGLLIAVAKGAIERIVGFRFSGPGWLFCFRSSGCSGRRWTAGMPGRALSGLLLFRLRSLRRELPASARRVGRASVRVSVRLTTSLSTGDLSALGRGRAGRIVRGCCDSLSGGAGAGLRTFAGTGSALNTWPHREHLKVGVSSGRTRSSIR